jgi:two-component system, chemotaxis family, CheB/CheR fusion protein
MSERGAAEFEALVEYLKLARGFDFGAYKTTTLIRRIVKRMHAVGIQEFGEYKDFLEVHPEEVNQLFNMILINVTSFFRDEHVWECLRTDIAPAILTAQPRGPIRIWSAGCASGEEAYTLAMTFAEVMGMNAFRERVKIYATDVDEEALADARLAMFTPRQVTSVPPELLAKYLEPADGRYVVQKELRRIVVFGRHDLLQDAPISRVNLLSCRNTLMYFNAEAQARVLERFEFALVPDGYLLLGKAEMLLGRAPELRPVDLKSRIFVRASRAAGRERINIAVPESVKDHMTAADAELREMALEADPVAQLVVDRKRLVVFANERCRLLFGVGPADIGRPIQDLELSYRPFELRSVLDRVFAERRPLVLKTADFAIRPGEMRAIEAELVPLLDPAGEVQGIKVVFRDVTEYRRLQEELKRSNQELETAYEELQSTNEELETTNEELQSTVEELETTNEELQSTNEELETMNEELQSTNEELHSANDELRDRGDDLNRSKSFLETILRTLQDGVIVVDDEMRVQAWNDKAYDLWGLRPEDVTGRPLASLDIGLPSEQLLQPIKACLSGTSEKVETIVEAMNRRGKPTRLAITCSSVGLGGNGARGAVLLMVEQQKASG